jgi:hypothetical protein
MTQIIEVVISPDGQSKVETKGFTGPSCQDASRFIEEALGSRVDEQLTGEFYQTQAQGESNVQRH